MKKDGMKFLNKPMKAAAQRLQQLSGEYERRQAELLAQVKAGVCVWWGAVSSSYTSWGTSEGIRGGVGATLFGQAARECSIGLPAACALGPASARAPGFAAAPRLELLQHALCWYRPNPLLRS